jgi:hypothetical protein
MAQEEREQELTKNKDELGAINDHLAAVETRGVVAIKDAQDTAHMEVVAATAAKAKAQSRLSQSNAVLEAADVKVEEGIARDQQETQEQDQLVATANENHNTAVASAQKVAMREVM